METLEEAIESHREMGIPSIRGIMATSFEAGAKWQKEQYNNVIDTLTKLSKCLLNADDRTYERELIRKALERL